jgi:hypothetical protein
MDFYTRWLIRSRLLAFIGAVLALGSTALPELSTNKYSLLLLLIGFLLLFIGILDGFGMFQKKKIQQAVRDREKAYKDALQPRQPWEK